MEIIEAPGEKETLRLLQAVHLSDPTYLPSVTSNAESLDAWFYKKPVVQSFGLVNERGTLLAYCGLSEVRSEWGEQELCRLFVAPGHRREGLGALLVQHVTETVPSSLWASSVRYSAGHRLLLSLGWDPVSNIFYDDDPHEGVVFRSPPQRRA